MTCICPVFTRSYCFTYLTYPYFYDMYPVHNHNHNHVVIAKGVEMEALVGATQAALCVYDMLKSMSHDIVITVGLTRARIQI